MPRARDKGLFLLPIFFSLFLSFPSRERCDTSRDLEDPGCFIWQSEFLFWNWKGRSLSAEWKANRRYEFSPFVLAFSFDKAFARTRCCTITPNECPFAPHLRLNLCLHRYRRAFAKRMYNKRARISRCVKTWNPSEWTETEKFESCFIKMLRKNLYEKTRVKGKWKFSSSISLMRDFRDTS